MRVLLDEHLPRRLADDLVGHEVRTVHQERWAGLTNGELLDRAIAAGFEVFLTADRNLEFQQNLGTFDIGFVVLEAPSNDITDLRSLIPATLEAIASVQPGQVVHVAA